MMRVFWEEWQSASPALVRKVLPALALVVGLALALSHFVPGFFFEVLAACFILGGLASGTHRWNRVQAWEWVNLQNVKPAAYVLGKVFGLGLLGLVVVAFLLPPLFLVMVLWAMPVEFVLTCLAWTVVGGLVAQALGQLTCWSSAFFSRMAGTALVFLWFAGTVMFKELNPYNPLWQISRLHSDPAGDAGWGNFAVLLTSSLAAWILTAAALTRAKEKSHVG